MGDEGGDERAMLRGEERRGGQRQGMRERERREREERKRDGWMPRKRMKSRTPTRPCPDKLRGQE